MLLWVSGALVGTSLENSILCLIGPILSIYMLTKYVAFSSFGDSKTFVVIFLFVLPDIVQI